MGLVFGSFPAVRSTLEQGVADRLRRRRESVLEQPHTVCHLRYLGLLYCRHSRLDGGPLGVSSYTSTSLVRTMYYISWTHVFHNLRLIRVKEFEKF